MIFRYIGITYFLLTLSLRQSIHPRYPWFLVAGKPALALSPFHSYGPVFRPESHIAVSVHLQLYYVNMKDLIVKTIADIYAQTYYLLIVTNLNSSSFILTRIQTQKKKFLENNTPSSIGSQAFN